MSLRTLAPTGFGLLALLASVPAAAVKTPEVSPASAEPSRILPQRADQQRRLDRSAAWQHFLAGDGAGWDVQWDERAGTPLRMWGPGVGPTVQTEAQAVDAFQDFVQAHADLLGIEGAELSVRSAHRTEDGALYVDLAVARDGHPIWRGGLTARFGAGRLVMVGAETFPHAPRSGAFALSQLDAGQAAIGRTLPGADHDVQGVRAVWLPRDVAGRTELRAVYEVSHHTTRPRGKWVSFVDAQTGDVLDVYDEILYFDGRLRASVDVRLGDGSLEERDLVDARVSTLDESTSTATDLDGAFTLPDDTGYVVALDGDRVRLNDQLGTIDPTVPADPEVVLDADDFDGRQAPLTTFVYLHLAQDFAAQYTPDNPWVRNRVQANVNIDDVCNAFFDGTVNFFQAGGGCNNTGRLADVIFHEWGHGLHNFAIVSGFYDGSLGEGAADTYSFLHSDDSRLAPNFFTRSAEPLRNVDNDQRYPEDFASASDVHFNGLIFGGAMWDTREALRATIGEPGATEVLGDRYARMLRAGPSIPTSYAEILFVDDDDGDLGNGTPHQCEIIEGFGLHGLGPLGGQGLEADHVPFDHVGFDEPAVIDALVQSDAPDCYSVTPASAELVYRVDGGAWQTRAMDVSAPDVRTQLEADELSDGSFVEYYVRVETTEGGVALSPSAGEIRPHTFYVGDMLQVRCEDFEEDDGAFTSELVSGEETEGANDWTWGAPQGTGGDPDQAASGLLVWGNDLGGGRFNGEYQNDKHNRLTSPAIGTRHYDDVFLHYSRWLHVEDAFYDQARILADGEVVWTNHESSQELGDEHHLDDRWVTHVVPLNGAEQDDQAVRVSWEILSDGGLTFGGWTLDDVCIMAPATPDNRLGITNLRLSRTVTAGPVQLTWTHPRHAPVERVRLVRKAGSYPQGADDGVVIWESDTIEVGQDAAALDPGAVGDVNLFYAVYGFDGEDWLSWTRPGMNAVALNFVEAGTPPNGLTNGLADTRGCDGCASTSPRGAVGLLALLLPLAWRRRR